MGVLLAVAVCVLLVVAAVVGPDQPSPWLRAVDILADWLGPLLIIVLGAYLARRRLMSWAERRLVELAGPALIRSMPPRDVLGALLPWIYGDRVGHQDVLTGVLGGAGRDPGGSDTAVSRSTTAQFRLRAIDDTACMSESRWTHELSGVRNNHRFVIFATCDAEIYSLVTRERIFPLFELWKLDNEDQLEDFVPKLRDTLQVGVTYLDDGGTAHVVEPRPQYGEEVALRHYEQFVRLPDSVDRKDLRIVQFDLYDLADPDDVVESIETLSIKASGVFPADLRYFSWSPPHPCFMRKVTFDVSELSRSGEKLVYLVVPSTMTQGRAPVDPGWMDVRDNIEIPLDSWMLPGHGVTLLWRPLDGAESRFASHDR